MKFSAFNRFFIFTLLISFASIVFISILETIRGSFNIKDTLIVSSSIVLFCLMFSIFGGIWAKQISVEISKVKNIATITDQINLLKNNKKFLIEESEHSYVLNSSKYYEWFYGKTIININSDTITINGAKCVINKFLTK